MYRRAIGYSQEGSHPSGEQSDRELDRMAEVDCGPDRVRREAH
jgi:hypothetical protein